MSIKSQDRIDGRSILGKFYCAVYILCMLHIQSLIIKLTRERSRYFLSFSNSSVSTSGILK